MPDLLLVTLETLSKMGFRINQQAFGADYQPGMPIAAKEHLNNVAVDDANRVISFQITNNTSDPENNFKEMMGLLGNIGLPAENFLQRVDIQGIIILEIGTGASKRVPRVVSSEFNHKIESIFNRSVSTVGIRISTSESMLGDPTKSPFVLLIEPLFTDLSDRKMVANASFATDNSQKAIAYLGNIYSTLKSAIGAF